MMCPPQAVHATTTTLLSRHLEEKSGLSRSLCRCEEKIMLPCHAMSTFSRAASTPARRNLNFPHTSVCWKSLVSYYSSASPNDVAVPLAGRRSSPPRHSSSSLHQKIFSSGRKALSSYEWKNMSKYAQQANKDFAEMTKEEIRKVGEEEINKVEKALKAMEPFNDVFTLRRDGLEIFAEPGPLMGTYWIKFDLSIHQICMVSPRSGPHRYIYDRSSGKWIGEADRHDFQGMLTRDIIQSACGIPDF